MINFEPLDDIVKCYGHIQDMETYSRVYRESLTPLGIKLLREKDEVSSDNRERKIRFHDYISGTDARLLPRYVTADFTRSLVPEVLTSISGAQRVLDLGCMDGLHTILYALNMPQTSFVGIDISQGSLHVANENKERYRTGNVKFVPADVVVMPFTRAFDAIVATGVLSETYMVLETLTGYRPDPCLIYKFNMIKRVAVPGAKIVVTFQSTRIKEFGERLQFYFESAGLELVDMKQLPFNIFDDTDKVLFVVAKTPS